MLWVRAAFTLLAGLGGAGLLAYGLLWVFVPQEASVRQRPESDRQRQQAFGLLALGVGLAVAGAALGNVISTWITGPITVALVGAAVVWREADSAQRRRWKDGARVNVVGMILGGGGRAAIVRIVAGGVLVAAGIVSFISLSSVGLDQMQYTLLAVLATLFGVAVLTVPWWVRLARDLSDERRARIRSEERAEIAAHLHDSVLQTLALIQKQGDDPREVRRLARGQERELRAWLYGPSGYGAAHGEPPAPTGATDATGAAGRDDATGATGATGGTIATALAGAAGEVEDTFAIAVQNVAVGDCALTEQLHPLVLAAREAMVNAAKHAGVGEVSVYTEVEPARVQVFVRDRGSGFDENTVSGDRHGLADSIRGRMERHGGTVRVRTAIGEGTEIQLEMPRGDGEGHR